MKTKTKDTTKAADGFDTVSFFRIEKERIAKEISNMSFDELKCYLKSKSERIKEDQSRSNKNSK